MLRPMLCLAGILILLALARRLLVIATVRHESMLPALADGDRVLALRGWPTRWLRRGQIVLAHVPQQPRAHPGAAVELVIKRIVALPGDEVSMSASYQVEVLQRATPRARLTTAAQQRWQIAPGQIFLCGDHGAASVDSRVWGPLPARAVVGVMLRTLPRQPRQHQQGACDNGTTASS